MVKPKTLAKPAIGLLIFAAGYAVMNRYLLVQAILYRLAVWDYAGAFWRSTGFALQAIALLIALIFVPARWMWVVLSLIFVSVWLNIGFGMIVGPAIDAAQLSWMLSESMQASAMGREFARPIIVAACISAGAMGLLWAARHYLRTGLAVSDKAPRWIGIAALILPFLLVDPFQFGPVDASRNAYVHLYGALSADNGVPRAVVKALPAAPPAAAKIVWLIDESIVYRAFDKILRPATVRYNPVDFGEAHSLGNCSAPSNFALRSGVDVLHANTHTDLRSTPSIWAYARKAGFRTLLIDGQTFGPMQNLMFAPERKLIDEFVPAKAGVGTDLAIARRINEQLRAPGRTFVFAVLHGAHFQYHDNYPKGAVPESSSLAVKYEAAVTYSKAGFFDALFAGVDRQQVAIFYTSDHGQNVVPGLLPHCSAVPGPDEFSVPLIAFLPQEQAESYGKGTPGGRSHGQIFPTSLMLMGYDKAVAGAYDNDLSAPTRRQVWFGRNVVPLAKGDEIEMHNGN